MMEPVAKNDHPGVRVLHKTLDILEVVRSSESGLRLAEVMRLVAMPKATVYRILSTLEGRGYLDRTPDGLYRISQKFFSLQRSEAAEQHLTRIAPPIISRLVDGCKETTNLGILDGGEVVVINTVESPQAVRMSSKIGNRRHLHSTSLGKVFLAGMSEKDCLRLLRVKGTPKLTPHTLTTPEAVLAEISRVREQGFAMDDQENEIEGRCIGAPVFGQDGKVFAALSISGPVFRMDVERALSLVPALKAACEELSLAARQR